MQRMKTEAVNAAFNLATVIDTMARDSMPCEPDLIYHLVKLSRDSAKIGHAIEVLAKRYEERT